MIVNDIAGRRFNALSEVVMNTGHPAESGRSVFVGPVSGVGPCALKTAGVESIKTNGTHRLIAVTRKAASDQVVVPVPRPLAF